MERSTIITLRGEGVSGVARLESHQGQLNALFSLKPQQQGPLLAIFICPDRMVEVPLTGNHCHIDEPLFAEGVLIARELPTGLMFLAEGGALHARLNFARIREELRFRHMGKSREVQNAPSPSPSPVPPPSPQAPPEISGRDDRASRDHAKRLLSSTVPEGAPMIEGEEHPLTAPKSEALKQILQQAETLYPQNHIEEIPTPSPGILQKGVWEEEVRHLLHAAPVKEPPAKKAADGIKRAEPIFNPFPDAFPRSCWKKFSFPGTDRFYLEGEVMKGNNRFLIHALPGEYSPLPRQEYREFARFLRATDGKGYWLRIRRK